MLARMSRPAQRAILASVASLAVLLAAPPPAARANDGLHILSQSTKSLGRGETGVAVGNDVMTSIQNPATLTEIEDMRVDGNLGLFIDRTRSTSRFEDRVDVGVIPIPAVGVGWDPFRPDAPDDGGPVLPSRARVALTFWQPLTLMISPSVSFAYRLTDTLSFGVSLQPILTVLNIQINAHAGGDPTAPQDFIPEGKVFVHYRPDGTPVTPAQPFDAGTGTQVGWGEVFTLANNTSGPAPTAPPPTTKINLQGVQGFGVGGQLGLFWQPLSEVAVGLSWRLPAGVFNVHGKAKIDLTEAIDAIKANPTIGQLLTAAFETYLPDRGLSGYKATYDAVGTNIVLPQILSLGTAVMPLPGWLLTLDLHYINWNAASSKITLKGSNGSNNDFNEINGGGGLTYVVKINWTDSFMIAAGTAISVTDNVVLRAGFSHCKNPMSSDFTLGSSLGTEDHATLGAGLVFTHWEFDVAYMYGLPTPVRVDAAQLRSTSEQHWIFFGVSYRW